MPLLQKVRVGVILLAIALALAPLPQHWIERWYSGGFYLHLQPPLTGVSNLFPFALFDVLIAGVAIAWLAKSVAALRRKRFGRAILRTAAWAAIVYLAFLFLWGLNYRREHLTAKLEFDPQAVSTDSALALASTAIDQLNALHDAAHAQGWGEFGAIDPSLASAFERVQRELGADHPAIPARPKHTLLNPFFRRAAVEGMTDPFFLETLIESDILPFERTMDVAHEWGHLAGYADESEASFVGWLTCVHGSAADQYSGWLFLFDSLAPRGRALLARIAPGPLEDLRAIDQRRRAHINRVVAGASERIYDGYLKANRVEAGIASYDEVAELILGTRFAPDWTPRMTPHALP